jgi:putative ABC transport system ATP-binding protein
LTATALKIYCGQGQNAKLILNGDCHFSVNAGELLYLSGASGVGKSTLLWTLARLHPFTEGQLFLKGQASQEIPISRWRAEVALLPQKPVMFSGTVEDNLYYPLHHFRIQTQRLLERGEFLPKQQVLLDNLQAVGLEDIALDREAASLSGGQQARLALVRTLLTKPTVLLADELLASIDNKLVDLVLKRLQQFCDAGNAVILTYHVREPKPVTQLILDGQGHLSVISAFSKS